MVNSLLKATNERPEIKIDWEFIQNPEILIRDLIIEGLSLIESKKDSIQSFKVLTMTLMSFKTLENLLIVNLV